LIQNLYFIQYLLFYLKIKKIDSDLDIIKISNITTKNNIIYIVTDINIFTIFITQVGIPDPVLDQVTWTQFWVEDSDPKSNTVRVGSGLGPG